MRNKIKPLLTILISVIITIFIISAVNSRLVTQGTYEKYNDFYCEDFNNYDVLFVGSSRMALGVSPIELWKSHGIMSYNLSNYGQLIPVNYWVLKDALKRCHPQLVVVDISYVLSDSKVSDPLVNHECFDLMPLSLSKIEAINDLFSPEDRFEYYFNFPFYHSRWSEVSSTFWDSHSSFQKGGNLYSDTDSGDITYLVQEPYPLPNFEDRILTETENKKYLREIISLCKSQDINVCLINCPSYRGVEYQKWWDSVNDIADEYGVLYLDFNRMEIDTINPLTDYRDEGHLNTSGARRFTWLLGDELLANFQIDRSHTDKETALWDNDYSEYKKFKVSEINEISDLPTYLMTLNDKDFDIIINVRSMPTLQDDQVVNMLNNLGVNEIPREESFLIFKNGHYEETLPDVNQSYRLKTTIGYFERQNENLSCEDWAYEIYLNDSPLFGIEKNAVENAVTRVAVLDSDTHELFNYKVFTFENINIINTYGD